MAVGVGAAWLFVAIVLAPDRDPDPFLRARQVELSSLESFADAPFADDLKAEQDEFANGNIRIDPETLSAMTDFTGRFTTVLDGERVTPAPPPCPCRTATVWLVGGSAAFGLGQRDDRTIAAELVRLAADRGIALRVSNLAVPGWTIHQGWLGVQQRLRGGERPDLVIFYDGFNDLTSAFIEASVRPLDPRRPNVLIADDLRRAQAEGYDLGRSSAREVADISAQRYLATLSAAEQGLTAAGVRTLFVLQPDAFASPRQLQAILPTLDPALLDTVEALRSSLDRFERLVQGRTFNARHELDDIAAPVYADTVHTNEAAARRIAELLVRPVLERASPS